MRVLDVDLQEALDKMNESELGRLLEKAAKQFGMSDLIDSKVLQQAVETVAGPDIAKIINDDSAISEIPDEYERFVAQSLRAEFGPQRTIDQRSIRSLINRTKLMNSGKRFAEKFTSMSSKEISDYLHDESLKLHDSTKYSIDPAYGISNLDKHNILRVMQAKAYAKELVSQIPAKEFQKAKNSFELRRNSGSENIEFMVKDVLGQEFDIFMAGDIKMIDLAVAFNEREKEQAHNNIFTKIKNLFNNLRTGRDKKKALPQGRNVGPNNKHQSYVDSIRFTQRTTSNEVSPNLGKNNKAKVKDDSELSR